MQLEGFARARFRPVLLVAMVLVAYLAYATPAASGATTCDRVSATTGSDTTGAGTAANPWRTAQKLSDSLTPGQTGCLRAGTYTEDVTATQGGTSQQRITIRSSPDEVARLAGRLTVRGDYLGFSQLVLDGRSAGGSGFGVTIEGDDVALMDNNITSRAAASCLNVGNEGSEAQRAYRLVLLRNRIHNCRTGVSIGPATNTAVLNNLIYDNVDRGVRMQSDAFSSYVWRNVIDGNGEGVHLRGGPVDAATSNAIHGNVISYSNSRWNVSSSFVAGNVGAYNHVWNNCLYATNPDPSFNANGGIVGASSTRGFDVYRQTLGEPQYADRDARDYHLAATSPCRGTSGDVAALFDGADTAPPDSAVPLKKPNVIVILTDDQRSEGTMVAMPKTLKWFQKGTLEDTITAGGTRFSEAIGTTPLCCPGRTSIVTGRYMHNHLVPHNQEEYSVAFDQSDNLQAYLGQPGADYFRGHIGRYLSVNTWLNPPYFDRWALSQGPYLPPIDVNEQGVRKVGLTGIQTYSTTYFKQQALQFLAEADQGGQTFFMHLGTYAPHTPFNADTPYNEANYPQSNFPPYTQTPAQQETDLSDKPSWVQAWNSQDIFGTNPEGERLKQLRTLKSVDDLVDEVFTQLEAQGNADDTLAFFTTDNGYNWDDHGLSNKSKPYIPGVQIPLFMRWPANPEVRRNFSDDRLVANIDIAPTVMDAAGVTDDPGTPMDGVSLLDPTKTRSRILSEYAGDQVDPGESGPFWKVPPWAAILTKDYHYIENYDSDGVVPTFREFYDLHSDPYELNNLYGGDGDPSNDPPTNPTAATLSAQLAKDRNCRGAECPPGPGAGSTTDTMPPKVVITAPQDDGITVNQNVDIDVSAWDNLGVVGVQFKLDGVNIAPEDTVKPFTMSWNTTNHINGSHVLSATARDAAGLTTTRSLNVTTDNGGIDIQAQNAGAIAGRPDTNDVITYSFGTAMNSASILPGWTGDAQSVTVKVNPDQPLYGFDDTVTLLRDDGTPINPMGVIDLGQATYVGFYEPGARFLNSTMTMSADRRSVTVRLGTPGPQSSSTKPNVGSMTWHTSTSAQTLGGQPFCACKVLEGIAAGDIEEREF